MFTGLITAVGTVSRARRDDDGLELVIGSSGSNRLRSAIMQGAVNVLDHGMPAREAVDHPRVHVEGDRLPAGRALHDDLLDHAVPR